MLITMKKQPDYLEPTSQPWRNYVDFQKDLPVAIDSASLQKQLYAINHYTDRTFKQRAYLGAEGGGALPDEHVTTAGARTTWWST